MFTLRYYFFKKNISKLNVYTWSEHLTQTLKIDPTTCYSQTQKAVKYVLSNYIWETPSEHLNRELMNNKVCPRMVQKNDDFNGTKHGTTPLLSWILHVQTEPEHRERFANVGIMRTFAHRTSTINYHVNHLNIIITTYMEVSTNGGTPKSSIYRWIFPCKPYI